VKQFQSWLRSGPCNAARAALQDALLVPALRAYCAPYRAVGAERLTMDGPLVIVANHASHFDAPAVLAALPHHLRHRTAIAAADDYFYRRRLIGLACGLSIGTFPFPRHGQVGIERAAALLEGGWNILIFPEGTRSQDGHLQPFRAGVANLLVTTRGMVLPVGIVGSHALWPRSHRWPRRGPLEVHFGRLWRPAASLGVSDICTELNRRVAALIGA
jgi:1-acyl-sn-glycerol-3-phosphate acyltransferase